MQAVHEPYCSMLYVSSFMFQALPDKQEVNHVSL